MFKKFFSLINGHLFKYLNRIKGGRLLKVQRRVKIYSKQKGSISIGERVHIYPDVCFFLDSPSAKIIIGDRTYINRRTEIKCQNSVEIGNDCAISWDVLIMDTDYHCINGQPVCKPVKIGDKVWIGCKSTILKGVSIGDGAVIASGALVNRDVPPRTMVGGVPARIIREDVEWQ